VTVLCDSRDKNFKKQQIQLIGCNILISFVFWAGLFNSYSIAAKKWISMADFHRERSQVIPTARHGASGNLVRASLKILSEYTGAARRREAWAGNLRN
jgi:hypothetical protein